MENDLPDSPETPTPEPISLPPEPPAQKGLTVWDYLIGLCSFIPLLGLLAAGASFLLGFHKIRQGGWRLILMGVLGILSTGAISYYCYYEVFLSPTGNMASNIQKANELNLARLVNRIEAYRVNHGSYPGSLADLLGPNDPKEQIFDLPAMRSDLKDILYYVYELQPDGQTYYLFSRGFDRQPYTADDIFPKLTPSQAATVGYRERPLSPLAMASLTPEATIPSGEGESQVTFLPVTDTSDLSQTNPGTPGGNVTPTPMESPLAQVPVSQAASSPLTQTAPSTFPTLLVSLSPTPPMGQSPTVTPSSTLDLTPMPKPSQSPTQLPKGPTPIPTPNFGTP
jgi:hypothetical protein